MTKFGVSQIENAPPKWWRKLERALIIVIIPASTTFVTSVVESEKAEIILLSSLTFLTALIKGIGVFLGNDVPYPQEKTEEYG